MLEDGARVVVIGAGPAGSFFAVRDARIHSTEVESYRA